MILESFAVQTPLNIVALERFPDRTWNPHTRWFSDVKCGRRCHAESLVFW